MSAIRQTTSKSLMLFTGRAYPELAEEIGGHLGVTPTPTTAYDFSNGELFVRFQDDRVRAEVSDDAGGEQ